ncbi:SMC-Scp complex subunit ScpB [Reichenbachiella agarivorans]|uniref:SMC-Scp complex subunit ScpB n=1 Tax=Reichenbachiella agarivorans TaxID=2979464 RepID=A0ABY6CVJ1_9BACT|nr:SMC-Scp complex subunit ScpB [Reichenbachiella agarivorans]UXP33488.1 SMC-Scp complex subunit ScpB [Reichenbachiella agarivorans]
MDFLSNHIEALIFCAPKPIAERELQECLSEMFEAEIPLKDIEEAIASLQQKYASEQYSFEPVNSGGGYQFLTKPAYQVSIGILLKQQSKKRLSNSALETLAIIAYKQPVTKGELEQIRGVNCDYSVQKLLEKELIEIKGKSEAVGRPIIYGTSQNFTDYFGINSISELPTLKDFEQRDNEIGDTQE